MWNVCRAHPYKHACIIRDAVNGIARALWGAKYSIKLVFTPTAAKRKAPSVLQIYADAQIIHVYKRKG